MSGDFEAALLTLVAPRLQRLGYRYDARLRREAELFGFCKLLDNGEQAVIQFQRRGDSTADRFTVNLIRSRAGEIQPRPYGSEAGASAARLTMCCGLCTACGIIPPPISGGRRRILPGAG